ncbi:MAG TPA: HD domain-containing protein [Clostridiales bacterium]|nr:HD domain-containing protein [Clostridiales bacterium]
MPYGKVAIALYIPKSAQLIIDRLECSGFEAYLVGGCVRDSLLGLQPEDYDICTSAPPRQILECFKDYTVIETGIKHGTVTVVIEGKSFEVTTFRADGTYSDNRRPDSVTFVKSLKEDLARRDFTINALAFNSRVGLVDYFGGRNDLDRQLVRCVGNPRERFQEDALRIIRALRFCSTLNFNLEPETFRAAVELKSLLKYIANERISSEFNKLLLGKGVKPVLLNCHEILSVIIPEISQMIGFIQNNPWHHLNVWEHTAQTVTSAPPDLIVRLTMLFHDMAKPKCYTVDSKGIGHFKGHQKASAEIAQKRLRQLRYDNKTIELVTKLVLYHDDEIIADEKHIKRWLSRFGEENFRRLIEVKRADRLGQNPHKVSDSLKALGRILEMLDQIIKEGKCFRLRDLAINGHDLIAIGFKEGRDIGICLNELLNLVMEDKLPNEKKVLLEYAENLWKNKKPL